MTLLICGSRSSFGRVTRPKGFVLSQLYGRETRPHCAAAEGLARQDRGMILDLLQQTDLSFLRTPNAQPYH
jgi:hypothetical protein